MEYSECKGGLLVKDKPFSGDGLFSRLGRNIARLSGYENNPEIIMESITVSVLKFEEYEINQLIDSVGKEL